MAVVNDDPMMVTIGYKNAIPTFINRYACLSTLNYRIPILDGKTKDIVDCNVQHNCVGWELILNQQITQKNSCN